MLSNRRYCYPLTLTDFASRYLISCEALSSTRALYAFSVFERVFKDFGLPMAIRTDNGTPFASAHSLFGLTKLSVWWLRLGIALERIMPAHPQQNGRHERMHRTLKQEATKPAAKNFLQQQGRFDAFLEEFNTERPHEAIVMRYPSEVYRPSPRFYQGIAELDYPFHDFTITVTACGRICIGTRKINLSTAFAGQNVGIRQVDDKIWLVSFMQYDLGFFDHETCRNQVWSWDITWLPTTVRGKYFHLYLVMDVWSRRIVGWRIAHRDSPEIAAELITDACRQDKLDPKGLVLHSDNGKPMRASTLLATLQWLGVVPSFSRPHVSDDNPYSEALFRTLKHTPAYPRLPFPDLLAAQRWMDCFVGWCNGQHPHSAIRYVTPDERHGGLDKQILEKRHLLYQRVRASNPKRWSGSTRNWSPVGPVVLNPRGTDATAKA